MWLWQRKNIHKKHLLWAKLFGICFIFHLIFLCWIFCIYHDNSYMLSISVNKHLDYSTPIMFVPYPNQMPEILPQKKTTITKMQPTPIAKKASVQTTIAQPKPIAQKKITEQTKMEPAKIESTKTEPPKKDISKPTVQKTEPTNAHISHNYREVEALRCSAQLQKELVRQWKPPIGVSPDCMCEISFSVNAAGTIENLKITKSSGIIMYDISARQALSAMKMPQWTYGKPLVISFKQ